ncbi:MAG: oxidoreductase, partial [Mycobacterium sp.]
DAFYLMTQPEYVGSAMAERANILTTQAAPQLRTTRRFDPAEH